MARGEIVLFARGDQLYAHRVIHKRLVAGTTMVVTKGDALPQKDFPLSGGELLGRVVRIHRGTREINLDSWPRLFLGWLLSLLSPWSERGYALARAVKRFSTLGRRYSEPL